MKEFNRNILLKQLQSEQEWDLVIIGGGATGLGMAVDGASRGYRTLLLEQADFAKGTSSRSTKLVHGGVRYLAQGDIGLVVEALRERGRLLNNAPHLTQNESIIIPCYSYGSGLKYMVGLSFYDWLSGRLSFGKSKLIKKSTLNKRLPTIQKKGLRCGVLYHDGTFDDARLALNLAQTAVEQGAVCLNYCRVTGLEQNDQKKMAGVEMVDQETGDTYRVKTKAVVNATGVFVDEILRMDNPAAKSMIRPSQGIHLVLDRTFLGSKDAIMIPKTDDGRVLFVIPWFDKVLMGTTDTPLNEHGLEPRALETEIEFVLKTAGRYLERQPEKADVLSVYAGLRPLAATDDTAEKTKEISRSHKVIVAASGLVSVIGGKWTTYRQMAEDTFTKLIKHKLLADRACKTRDLKIHGATQPDSQPDMLSGYGADRDRLVALMKMEPALKSPLDAAGTVLKVQVAWAARYEMARTVEDVLARRTRILFRDAKKAIAMAPVVAEILATELDKDAQWQAAQIADFTALAKGYLLTPDI